MAPERRRVLIFTSQPGGSEPDQGVRRTLWPAEPQNQNSSRVPRMELRLDGKVALVTGASRGIGKAIAAAYAEAGASVMLTSRKADALEKAAADMQGEVAWHAANTGDPEASKACVDATVERFGAVDILVNNAAANPYMGPLMNIETSHMDKIHQVNQRALIL